MAYEIEIPFRNGREAVIHQGQPFEVFNGSLYKDGISYRHTADSAANHIQGFRTALTSDFLFVSRNLQQNQVIYKLTADDLLSLGIQQNEIFSFELAVEHIGAVLGPATSDSHYRMGIKINGNTLLAPSVFYAGGVYWSVDYTFKGLVKDRYFGAVTDPHLLKWSVKQAEFTSKVGSPVSAYNLANGFSVTESGNARAGIAAQMLGPNDSLIAARLLGKARLNHRSPRGAKGSVRPVFADRTFAAVNTPIRLIGDTTNQSFDVTYNAGANVIDASNLADVNLGLDLVIDNF